MRLSNSEMAMYRRCRRKWWLSTYRQLVRRSEHPHGSPISIGNLVHNALAEYYDPMKRYDPVKFVRETIDSAVAENPGYEMEILKEAELCEIMVQGYVEWLEDTGADSDLRFLGSERVVEVPLKTGITLISKLDAPVEQISDGAKLALEHKTVGSLDEPLNSLRLDTQLLTEHLVRFLDAQTKGATPDEAYDQCQGVLYNMLRKVKRTARAKPPFYGREQVMHNRMELKNHWIHVKALAEEIEMTRARLNAGYETHHIIVPPSPMKDCKWSCPFFPICPMFDDGSRVEDAIEAMFVEGNPLERYEGAEEL